MQFWRFVIPRSTCPQPINATATEDKLNGLQDTPLDFLTEVFRAAVRVCCQVTDGCPLNGMYRAFKNWIQEGAKVRERVR